jgi:geranylgeranyl pyrophosphate synthase
LIATAARVGAIIGGAGSKDLERVTRYAQALGLAFQITDDILDGHEVSSDNGKGTVNYLSVMEPARAHERVQDLLSVCLREMRPYGRAAEPLRELARFVALRTDGGAGNDGRSVVASMSGLDGVQRLEAAPQRRQP